MLLAGSVIRVELFTCAECLWSPLYEYGPDAVIRTEGCQGIVLCLHHVCNWTSILKSRCNADLKAAHSQGQAREEPPDKALS